VIASTTHQMVHDSALLKGPYWITQYPGYPLMKPREHTDVQNAGKLPQGPLVSRETYVVHDHTPIAILVVSRETPRLSSEPLKRSA